MILCCIGLRISVIRTNHELLGLILEWSPAAILLHLDVDRLRGFRTAVRYVKITDKLLDIYLVLGLRI